MSILPDFSTEELRKRKSDLEGYLKKAKYKGNKKKEELFPRVEEFGIGTISKSDGRASKPWH